MRSEAFGAFDKQYGSRCVPMGFEMCTVSSKVYVISYSGLQKVGLLSLKPELLRRTVSGLIEDLIIRISVKSGIWICSSLK